MSNAIGWIVAGILAFALVITLGKTQPLPTVTDTKSPTDEVLPGMYVFGGGRFVVKWIGFGEHSEIIVGMRGSSEPPIQIMATKSGLRVSSGTKIGTPIGSAP